MGGRFHSRPPMANVELEMKPAASPSSGATISLCGAGLWSAIVVVVMILFE